MSDISIPQSVQDYFKRRGIQTAVDLLLAQDNNYLPENLEWDELRSFHKSLLAAYTIRTDYALLLLDAWDAIWGPALSACGVNEALPIDDHSQDEKPSIHTLWQDSHYRAHCYLDEQDKTIWTRIFYASLGDGLRLGVGLWNNDGLMLEAEFDLGESWIPHNQEQFDGWFSTKAGAFRLDPDSNSFDPSELRRVAEAAIRRLSDV